VILLTAPMIAGADDQTIPPEANWTPTPPARQTVDVVQLASLLVEKGMITPREYAQLTHPNRRRHLRKGAPEFGRGAKSITTQSCAPVVVAVIKSLREFQPPPQALTTPGALSGSRRSHRRSAEASIVPASSLIYAHDNRTYGQGAAFPLQM